jgi:hypothetical protein
LQRKLFKVNRLDKVGIGTTSDAADALWLGTTGCGDDQSSCRQVGALPKPIESIAVWQAQIQQDDIVAIVDQELIGFMQGSSSMDHESIEQKVTGDSLAEICFVFDDKNLGYEFGCTA